MLIASCGSDDAADEGIAVQTCDGTEATICIVEISSLDSDAALALDRAVELDGGPSVDLEAGACGAAGDGPDEVTWSLCRLALEDGRQIVVGRSTDSGTIVRASVAGQAIEFPLATAPGAATVLISPAQAFVIVNADGDEIGSTAGG